MPRLTPTRLASLLTLITLLTIPETTSAQVSPHAGMLRFPDVSANQIVFVYANDLWVVNRSGGLASPLASPAGAERFPKFSDDGQTIAFMGNYDGNSDLYTIPISGGIPHRVTYHPAGETLSNWTSDGRLIFSSSRQSGIGRSPKLFTVPAQGGLPDKLPVPYGGAAAISPDGTWLAYTPYNRDSRSWKRYRGGNASNIWLFNLKTNESKQVTDWEGTDTIPMWSGEDLYYLSDQGKNHRLNIWWYDRSRNSHEQITKFSDYDVKWPSMGPGEDGRGEIVFQCGPALYLLDLRNNSTKTVSVQIPGARPKLRPRRVDVSRALQGGDISPTGKRLTMQMRGDIWTAPAEKGLPRNLTRTSGAAERSPSWSPDGQWIAYLSDATGEYEFYLTQSDGKGETRQLTHDGTCFRYGATWAPDSEKFVFSDKTGALYLHTLESGETKEIARDPAAGQMGVSWSHDSRWLTYSHIGDESYHSSIYLYDTESGTETQVTSAMFNDSDPTFDRKGDWLYFTSDRIFNSPKYSSIDGTFVYRDSGVLLAVPLRKDVEYPWTLKSDEETWDDDTNTDKENGDAEKNEDSDDGDKAEGGDADNNTDPDDGSEGAAEAPDDGITGTWEGELSGAEIPPGMMFTMQLSLGEDGATLSGSISVPMGSGTIDGTWDPASGAVTGTITTDEGDVANFDGTIKDGSLNLAVSMEGVVIDLTGERTGTGDDEDGEASEENEEAAENVEIDLQGFEHRALQLPVPPGQFGNLAVNHKNQLLYIRGGQGGNSGGGIKMFDLEDEKKAEKSVTAGQGFGVSADGKKIVVARGGSLFIANASAGATAKKAKTDGMIAMINPREEWNQLFNDTWRIFRDFFYQADMHGVDWPAVRTQYAAMVKDCNSREDLSFVFQEMIAELNSGHTYYFGGDQESAPGTSVGLLGVDFTLENGAYRIAKILEGGVWDSDARGPLSQPGVDVKEGDYLLAVNRIPLDPTKDPWAAFQGLAGKEIELTVSETPEMNDDAREVIVKALGREGNLRYRAWIERNRAFVAAQTDGQVGYIHVPDTGVNGQNNLFRQFYGQCHLKALIIDERWNGGGQLPNRFIELLSRPTSNFWARRDGRDWRTPDDSHQGPKCMLINGPAGSGGDMFPWLFKHHKVGKVIGRRTWGGLIGLSGNPGLIDGGRPSVPTFGFYETDGTWGVEGHGVDPDIEVLDDPALMVHGGDPQLNAAIALMLKEIKTFPYQTMYHPQRPQAPDRSGMGVKEEDK